MRYIYILLFIEHNGDVSPESHPVGKIHKENGSFVKPYLASVLFCVEISNYAKSDTIYNTLLIFMLQYSDFISF
jgi:hypothetical protein